MMFYVEYHNQGFYFPESLNATTTEVMSVSSSHLSSPIRSCPPSRVGTCQSLIAGASSFLSKLEPEINASDKTELISVSWNQDYGCFAAGTSHGFHIYNCDPYKETFGRDLKCGGFKIVEMLFRCNILVLVGAKSNSQHPPNKVMIWDDHQSRCIGEFTFRSDVCAVKLRRDQIVVVLDHKIYVYNFMDLKLLHLIETLANPRGLCCLSQNSNTCVLACPSLQRGMVCIEHFGLNMTKIINAHDSHIACLALTMDGLLLATASTKGTLIRIFNTMDGTRLQEVRRGVDTAEIYSIALSPSVQWLAVSSDKGVLPKYFSSEWSFAKFHLLEHTRFIATFGSHNTVIILGMDGSFYRCSFDPVQGGKMLQEEYIHFLKTDSRPR